MNYHPGLSASIPLFYNEFTPCNLLKIMAAVYFDSQLFLFTFKRIPWFKTNPQKSIGTVIHNGYYFSFI
jgi:hypothetical protein